MYDNYGWAPYVSVAERRSTAAREIKKIVKKGRTVSPVVIEGHSIARTFWGKAWCANLERYSDYENRLPRGRTYVRNGSVVDLQIDPGEVRALVSGSRIYKVTVKVSSVPKVLWESIRADCAGAIDSLVELLQGRFAKGVMERICRPRTGLFPAPAAIKFSCTCPDWASMCKHVAAVLYGIGARLDEKPELLFKLRKVDEKDLISASADIRLAKTGPAMEKVLKADISEVFGLDMAAEREKVPAPPAPASRKGARRSASETAASRRPATRKKRRAKRN